jgi:hypothetical protein
MIDRVTQVYEEDITPEVNQENSKVMIMKDHVTRTPYRHPNQKSQHCNQPIYRHRCEQRQHFNYILKKINSSAI